MMSLLPREIHLWTASLPQNPVPGMAEVLSQEERDSACRFHFEKHQSAYIFAHAVLRDILSRYLALRPEEFAFSRDAFGKPFLVGRSAAASTMFNLSHSGGLVLVALACKRRIGVDVEETRPLENLETIAESNLTTQECAFILSHSPDERQRAFFRCWTRKQAYAKA